ncbi:hypothetical protein [uncultured Microbacterium sp.]|uniref:hypothetical protein n=1 Tax=uncultured Microbacterium sp. TaxID=191216 RepID=UPI0035CC9D77
MARHATVADLSPLIRSRTALLDTGWTERGIASAVARKTLSVVRRGWYMAADEHAALWPEGRHLAHVIAVARDATGAGVVSHASAGVLWDLPLYRHSPAHVHMTLASPGRISSGRDVMRHLAPLPREDVVIRHGIRCTTLERTVFDEIRTLGAEASVACADAGERLIGLRGRVWDEDAVAWWRRAMNARLLGVSGARGVRQARWVAAFANGRAQLPGESVSRLQLVRLGFGMPRLQVRVEGPGRKRYFVDFGLDDVRTFGEFDGKGKYLDEAMRRGLTLEQVLLEEKQREDWIRGTTHWRFARWGDEHIRTPEKLGAHLASFSIRPPR